MKIRGFSDVLKLFINDSPKNKKGKLKAKNISRPRSVVFKNISGERDAMYANRSKQKGLSPQERVFAATQIADKKIAKEAFISLSHDKTVGIRGRIISLGLIKEPASRYIEMKKDPDLISKIKPKEELEKDLEKAIVSGKVSDEILIELAHDKDLSANLRLRAALNIGDVSTKDTELSRLAMKRKIPESLRCQAAIFIEDAGLKASVLQMLKEQGVTFEK